MQSIIEQITEWLRTMLVSGIMGNLAGLFDGVNQQVGEIAGNVGMTPAQFSPGIFSLIRNISETVIMPIADEADLLSLMDEDELEVLKENSPQKTEEVIIEPIKEEPVHEKEISRDTMTSPILLVLLIATCGGVVALAKLGKKKKAPVPTVPEEQEEECEGFIELEDELHEMEEGDYESV